MRWYPLCTRPRHAFQFAKCPSYWNDSQQVDMSLHYSNYFSSFLVNEFLLLLLSDACWDVATTIFSGLTWPVLQTMIYCTRVSDSQTFSPTMHLFSKYHCAILILVGFTVFGAPFNNISYIVVVSFIGGGHRSTRRKPPTCRKSWKNFIKQCCIDYTSADRVLKYQR